VFGPKINAVVLFAVLTLATFVVVFWATWSTLQHPGAAPSAAGATNMLPVKVLGLLSWGITAGYGVWLAATGRKVGNLPRNVTGRALRWFGIGEVVLSLLAIWAILSQPANTAQYGFAVLVGILALGMAIPRALRGRKTGV
jgi:hypothetical protein